MKILWTSGAMTFVCRAADQAATWWEHSDNLVEAAPAVTASDPPLTFTLDDLRRLLKSLPEALEKLGLIPDEEDCGQVYDAGGRRFLAADGKVWIRRRYGWHVVNPVPVPWATLYARQGTPE